MKNKIANLIFVMSVFFIPASTIAQTWNIPSTSGGGTSTSYIGTTTANDIYIGTNGVSRIKIFGGPGTTANWAGTIKLMGYNTYFNFGGIGTGQSGNCGVINWPHEGNLYFRTLTNTDDNSTFTDKMIILGNGNVGIGIGTALPTTKLEVGGVVKATGLLIPTGAALNKVLTSDASGNASWQTFTGGSGGWLPTGNAAAATDFVGTTNTNPLTFKVNSTEAMRILSGGNIGIGTITPSARLTVVGTTYLQGPTQVGSQRILAGHTDYKFSVDGKIICQKLITTPNGWADYVFSKNYKLRTLAEVEKYIIENKHLPEIPSEQEVLEKGIEVGEMNRLLLLKIEELTKYIIEQEKRIQLLENK